MTEPSQQRQRGPTLTTLIKQAEKAGKRVILATVRTDGSKTLTFGNADNEDNPTVNPWDAVLNHDRH